MRSFFHVISSQPKTSIPFNYGATAAYNDNSLFPSTFSQCIASSKCAQAKTRTSTTPLTCLLHTRTHHHHRASQQKNERTNGRTHMN